MFNKIFDIRTIIQENKTKFYRFCQTLFGKELSTNKSNKIYDCFTFFNELDLLELRLNVLNDYVDKFVLVEATKTQNNQDKILYYEENKCRFKKFENKIIHIVVNDYPEILKQWTIENYQRNAIVRGLVNCKPDDIIVISDLDEIPRPEYIRKYYNKDKITALDLDVFNFYLNYYSVEQDWTHGPKILSYNNLLNILDSENNSDSICIDYDINPKTTPSKIRLYYGQKQEHIEHGGWHFSYIGKDCAIQKIKSTCEGKIDFTEKDYNELLNSKKLLDFDLVLVPVKISKFFPKYLVDNQDKYKQYILNTKPKNIELFIFKIDLKNKLEKISEHRIIKKIQRKISKIGKLFQNSAR